MTLSFTINQIIADAIERRVFPGAVVLVAREGQAVHEAAYGTTMYDAPGTRPVALDTIYDIASLTKVFTATAALALCRRGRLDLDEPAAAYLPELHAQDVRVRHLLTHTSGLDIRLSTLRHHGRDGLMAAAYEAAQIHPPGARVAYTNVNALLLGEIVARHHGTSLDTALHELVMGPLGLEETRFAPATGQLERIAPTEIDDDWRGGLVHGSVHDESTHALGGVAGHAGLFSTAQDQARFCQAWLDLVADGRGPLGALIGPELAREACRNHTTGLHMACGLGWMVDRANFMGAAPAGTFGHTGFTGPAIVVAPAHQLVVVVLCNRVYPRRSPPPYAHHAVIAAVIESALGTTR
ncbi:MAG TPA: serine hydrolase domain-containing protein [Roseiflexaceae bacterium]|nr:serine hydrolase domain-containing protein [Roseiflexaceae bacterium]